MWLSASDPIYAQPRVWRDGNGTADLLVARISE